MLKIITLNCQRSHQEGCNAFLQDLLNSNEYDFVLLQEANEKVHKVISDNLNNYSLIFTENSLTNTNHEVCLIYRSEFELIKKDFLSFHNPAKEMLTQSGSAIGLFKLSKSKATVLKKEYILIASLHLQASYHARTRQIELRQIKSIFGKLAEDYDPIKILGGDFNNLGPGEFFLNNIILKPGLVYASHFDDHTYDSTFLEPIHLSGSIAKILLATKMKYKAKIDHYYVDPVSFESLNISSEVIKIDVSDHRPVVITIEESGFEIGN